VCVCVCMYILDFTRCTKKKLRIIAVCLHSKFKLNWLMGTKKNNAMSHLKDSLGISENSSNDNKLLMMIFLDFHQKVLPKEEELQDRIARFFLIKQRSTKYNK